MRAALPFERRTGAEIGPLRLLATAPRELRSGPWRGMFWDGESSDSCSILRRCDAALPKRADRQFFWMMQLPPAAFNPLHNFAAFSADAKGPTRAR